MERLNLESFTLYLDNAGDPGWPPPFGLSKLQWYVYGGLMLSTESDFKARDGIKALLDKYITVEERAKWPIKYFEIHYHDLIRGHNIYGTLDHPQRKAMADELFAMIPNLKPILFATAVNKVEMKRRYGSDAYDPRSYALRATIHRYSMYLDYHKVGGSIVVDEEEYRRDKNLRQMIHEFRSKGIVLRSWDYNPRFENTLERILNTVNFSPSSMSPGLQLADVVTRATWSHFERGKSQRFDQLRSLWNDPSRSAYDPSVVPKTRQALTNDNVGKGGPTFRQPDESSRLSFARLWNAILLYKLNQDSQVRRY